MAAPNVDKILIAYLNALLDERVVGKSPDQILDPWVRVTLLSDASTHGGIVDHSIEALFQVDCFAGKNGTQGTAKELSLEVRELMRVTNEQAKSAGGGWIVGSTCSFSFAPDQTYEDAMECYRGSVTAWFRS